ncbi:MAG: 50S ribosomal protein L21 [bacterium]
MFAVVEIAAQQFTVRPADTLTVPLLDAEVGSSVEFGNILLGGEESNVSIGNPYLSGTVKATVLAHGKGDKVLVFKKKRRKGYRKLNGHRQQYTQIKINDIKLG